MGLRFILLTGFFIFISAFFNPVYSQDSRTAQPKEERLEGVVTKIREEKQVETGGKKQFYQKLEILITSQNRKGKMMVVENGNIPQLNVIKYNTGDKLVITAAKNSENQESLYITDFVRTPALYWLFAIFVSLTIIIGGRRGAASLIGMGFTFVLIFTFVLPRISSGYDPILIVISAALLIIPVNFYLSHGFNSKTSCAVAGTIISLLITGLLANFFVDAVRLTGFASEEAAFLQSAKQGMVNIRGLLLAGIIIGVLGVLDDISITQASIVSQLKKASPKSGFVELYSKAMDVGKDHIASVVNTLILVYSGAALPLLLLFIDNPLPFGEVINYEIIAEEIVRTLVASIGLILAVPITTFLTAYFIKK